MKSSDYLSDTWCLLVGMSRGHGESPPQEFVENLVCIVPIAEPHVPAWLLAGLLMVVSCIL